MEVNTLCFVRRAAGALVLGVLCVSAAQAAHLQGDAQSAAIAQADLCSIKAQALEDATDAAAFDAVGNPNKPNRTEAGLEMTADGILSGLLSTSSLLALGNAKQDKAVTEVAKVVEKLDKYELKLSEAVASGALMDPMAIELLTEYRNDTDACALELQGMIGF